MVSNSCSSCRSQNGLIVQKVSSNEHKKLEVNAASQPQSLSPVHSSLFTLTRTLRAHCIAIIYILYIHVHVHMLCAVLHYVIQDVQDVSVQYANM